MRIVVLGAGGPAGVNVCRALDAAGHEVIGIDESPLHLAWAEPYCSETRELWGKEQHLPSVDLYHAQPERAVRGLAHSGLPKLMPTPETVTACQHKPTTAVLWHANGLRRFPPVAVGEPLLESLDYAAEMFGLPFWLRSAVGAGAKAATLVEDVKTGFHWIKYWETRGETIEWVAEEYLPGRDFCWTGVYRHGILYASFARERLEWLYPHLAPSGRTGTPTVSEVVHDERVNVTAKLAVEAVDAEPNGIFCVDLREDREGVPRPTEINAGRWATTSPLYHELGPNLPALHARLAVGETVEPWGDDIYPAGTQLLRHIDCGHVWRSNQDSEPDAREPSRVLARA
jgi:hypothetical protein